MQIILKYLIKSITEKKMRTFLVVLAVALAGALYLASTALSASVVQMQTDKIRETGGNVEIHIYAGKKMDTNLLSMHPAQQLEALADYIIPVITGNGLYEKKDKGYDTIQLTGIELEDYIKMNKLVLKQQLSGATFDDRSLIISQKTAEKYKLQVGDSFEMRIGEKKRKLVIYGIAYPQGLFGSETEEAKGLMRFSALSQFFGTEQKPTLIYMKSAAEKITIDELIEKLRVAYPKAEVKEFVDRKDLEESISWIAQPLLMMTVLVTFMSIYIVHSSFKVITLEKLPVIGTFRSIGASKRMVNRVLLLESIGYGIIGGICAILLGFLILFLMLQFLSTGELEGAKKIKMEVGGVRCFITFCFSLLVSVISSMLPILKVGKIPVKDIVLGNGGGYKKKKVRKSIIGTVSLFISIGVLQLTNGQNMMILSSLSLTFLIIGVINLLPTLVRWTSYTLQGIFEVVFGNIGVLAVRNIKANKNMLNSITLITLGVSMLLFIVNISINVQVEVLNFYDQTFQSDMVVWMENMDKGAARALESEKGVEDVVPVYEQAAIKVQEWEAEIWWVEGITGPEYDRHVQLDYMGKKEELLGKINEDRYLILTKILKDRYGVKEGDKLSIATPKGNRIYTVLGFMNTFMNNGNYALMSEKYLKLDMNKRYYDNAYLLTSDDEEEALNKLQKKYENRYLSGRLIRSMKQSNKESNDQMMMMMVAFSILAVIIGIVGIVNNLFISFIERKQNLAVLRSIGMSKRQIMQMVFLEALALGILGAIIGIVTGWGMFKISPYILEGMQCPIPMHFIKSVLWLYVIGAIGVTIMASITPASKSSKFNIIEAIKYE
ncbi:hypothetical protein CS063_06070 [Sporanaerobium hydrogeniformans]|uniref:Uncharacterized protein n=1 Tax=Sporanaerobium hydrogeniformans TaxID=3072179 RepID=A0AC61DED6_9FIRM|nr:FtsX-like permease family protein [Sporanaerobium hydrogeniformans]PHV71255.1 hypothetical protein CS063_06070 [Sporanaerobium hydrogeniformans]